MAARGLLACVGLACVGLAARVRRRRLVARAEAARRARLRAAAEPSAGRERATSPPDAPPLRAPRELHAARVAIVGLGGVGSHCAALLARAGVRDFVLVDFDFVSLSSLNRHAAAVRANVGTPKVYAVRDQLLAILAPPGHETLAADAIAADVIAADAHAADAIAADARATDATLRPARVDSHVSMFSAKAAASLLVEPAWRSSAAPRAHAHTATAPFADAQAAARAAARAGAAVRIRRDAHAADAPSPPARASGASGAGGAASDGGAWAPDAHLGAALRALPDDALPDLVIDAIDDVRTKAELLLWCAAARVPVLSALGAGGKLDGARLHVGALNDVVAEPLGRALVARLRAALAPPPTAGGDGGGDGGDGGAARAGSAALRALVHASVRYVYSSAPIVAALLPLDPAASDGARANGAAAAASDAAAASSAARAAAQAAASARLVARKAAARAAARAALDAAAASEAAAVARQGAPAVAAEVDVARAPGARAAGPSGAEAAMLIGGGGGGDDARAAPRARRAATRAAARAAAAAEAAAVAGTDGGGRGGGAARRRRGADVGSDGGAARGAVAGMRVRVVPVMGPMPALFGAVLASEALAMLEAAGAGADARGAGDGGDGGGGGGARGGDGSDGGGVGPATHSDVCAALHEVTAAAALAAGAGAPPSFSPGPGGSGSDGGGSGGGGSGGPARARSPPDADRRCGGERRTEDAWLEMGLWEDAVSADAAGADGADGLTFGAACTAADAAVLGPGLAAPAGPAAPAAGGASAALAAHAHYAPGNAPAAPGAIVVARAPLPACWPRPRRFPPVARPRLSAALKAALRERLYAREALLFGNSCCEEAKLSLEEVEYVASHVWHGRCALCGERIGSEAQQFTLAVWRRCDPINVANLLLLRCREADIHAARALLTERERGVDAPAASLRSDWGDRGQDGGPPDVPPETRWPGALGAHNRRAGGRGETRAPRLSAAIFAQAARPLAADEVARIERRLRDALVEGGLWVL
ncbi:hypothetical protein KFE25_005180 [Diacronema lutheri]|uniref:THIF-type NAD/FAD binding fold domain-containing protein n=2 Tax=Diacronema lutheri TaxID=2081491 RepID=A0A8J6C8B7_DIALT|nr:hypothetical protein KFE25_005180 [Diacronema lutheri]